MFQRKKGILIFLLLLGISSCNKESSFTSYYTLGIEGMSSKPYVFDISNISFESKPQNLFVNLRNDNSYAFNNIFLICSLRVADELVFQDTLEYAMAKPDGTWLGEGFTEVKESKLWWKERVFIPERKPLFVEISHAMRVIGDIKGISNLEGIVSVGLSIEAPNK